MKPGLDFIKYLDHNMMSSNTIGIRVSLGEQHVPLQVWVRRLELHLNLWRSKHSHSVFAHGPEVHVVPRGDPEPHGVGVPHVGVVDLGQVQVRLHQVP